MRKNESETHILINMNDKAEVIELMPLGKETAYLKLWDHDVWGEDRDCEIFKIEMITSPNNHFGFFLSGSYDSSAPLKMMTVRQDNLADWEEYQHTGYETFFEIEVTAVDSTTDI